MADQAISPDDDALAGLDDEGALEPVAEGGDRPPAQRLASTYSARPAASSAQDEPGSVRPGATSGAPSASTWTTARPRV